MLLFYLYIHNFLLYLKGCFNRTDIETEHIGERPIKENINLLKQANFEIENIKGVTLTVPFIYRKIICRNPQRFLWLHDFFEIFTLPSLAMLNVFLCKVKK